MRFARLSSCGAPTWARCRPCERGANASTVELIGEPPQVGSSGKPIPLAAAGGAVDGPAGGSAQVDLKLDSWPPHISKRSPRIDTPEATRAFTSSSIVKETVFSALG